MDIAQRFLSQVKDRSAENVASFHLLHENGNYSVCIGLLRQELDSLLRLCYLWRPETTADDAVELMQDSVQGKKWAYRNEKGKTVVLRDADMLSFAAFLGGWEQVVYAFGCKAIHLSDLHAYKNHDPLASASAEVRDEVIGYLKSYHGYHKQTISMADLYYFLPNVMQKLADNVEFYLEELGERYVDSAP